jgi:trans-aconitate methyltransferase
MLDAASVTAADSVADIGGGASRLVDELVARGFHDVTVVDASAEAVHVAQDRLGELAGRVRWLVRDVLTWKPQRTWRVWHDRAVLHFFTTPTARDAYLGCLHMATTPDSIAVIATFAPDGPEHCSGLPVARYDARQLAELLGHAWQLVAVDRELHTTPSGTVQPFTWTTSRRTR